MNYWNPGNKAIVYLHYCGFGGGSLYLKVDVINRHVVVVCEKNHDRQGKRFIIGIYTIKWITFIGNYVHYAKHWGTNEHSMDGVKLSNLLKLTTRNQYEMAKERTLKLLA